jgi:hypothetical protein
MKRVTFLQKTIEYGGAAFLFYHLFAIRLKINKYTPLYIVMPPILSYMVKIMGYLWVDEFAESSGMYKVYNISTF